MGDIISFGERYDEKHASLPIPDLHIWLAELTDQLFDSGSEDQAEGVLELYQQESAYMDPVKALARAIRRAAPVA